MWLLVCRLFCLFVQGSKQRSKQRKIGHKLKWSKIYVAFMYLTACTAYTLFDWCNYNVLSAFGTLSYQNTHNVTFKQAEESCQREGKELIKDLDFLMYRSDTLFSTMPDKQMSGTWVGNKLNLNYWGR